jgi:hypothetical protein
MEFLEKLKIAPAISWLFMESDGSLRYRYELVTGSYHEPDGTSPASVPRSVSIYSRT